MFGALHRFHRRQRALPLHPPQPCAVGGNVEEKKAIQHSQLPSILQRPETAWEVLHKVGKGHLTTGDKGGVAGQYTTRYQQPADEFNTSSQPHQGEQRHGGTGKSAHAAEQAKEFLRPVAGKQ